MIHAVGLIATKGNFAHHTVFLVEATSVSEATGIGYQIALTRYPASSGWGHLHIIANTQLFDASFALEEAVAPEKPKYETFL